MEQSQLDISALKFGNLMLDRWLNDETGFWKFIVKSLPCQICMVTVFNTLVYLKEMEPWNKIDQTGESVLEAREQAIKFCPEADQNKIQRLVKAVFVLNILAEKRLIVTSGV